MPTSHYRTVRAYQPSSSRYIGFGFVVVFHIVLAYFLIQTLNHRNVEKAVEDVKVAKVDEQKPDEKTPPPPPPDLNTPPPPPFVPPVEVNIAAPPAVTTNAIQTVTNKVPVAPPPPPAPKATTPPRLLKAVDTESLYPAISKRLNEEGVVTISILVNADGRISDCKVVKSSGFSRLDNAACNGATGGKIQMAPGTEDGKPAAQWNQMNIRFKFSD
jgi:protein TonB